MTDSLKIKFNEDGSFTIEWDKDDPNWKLLNGLPGKEIRCILVTA